MASLGLAVTLMTGCATGSPSVETGGNASGMRDWEAIEASGTLRVGTEGTYSPYSYHGDAGDLTGYDIELVRAIGDRLGLEVEFQEMGFDGLAAGLDADQFDMVADQICVTPERREKYLFSEPYAYVTGVVITKDDADGIASFDDLDGKRVALTLTSNWARLAESYGAEIVSTGGFAESMQMVVDGRVDATVNDNLVFLDYMAEHPAAHARIAATAGETDTVALLMRGDQGELRGKVDEAMSELRDEGFLTRLSERYFGEDIASPKGEDGTDDDGEPDDNGTGDKKATGESDDKRQ